jgi:hypothetical protein
MKEASMWEVIDFVLKALGFMVGAAVSLYQLRNLLPGSRSRLKADLEILELLGKDHPLYPTVKSQTDEQLRRTYSQALTGQDNRPLVYNWGMLVLGATFLLVFSGWTVYIVRDGFNWWSLLTGFLAMSGFGNLMGSLQPRSSKPPEGSHDQVPEPQGERGAT